MKLSVIKNCREELMTVLEYLGYPREFGLLLISELKYDKAVTRLLSYIRQFRPGSAEVIADEMLAIKSDFEKYKDKAVAEHCNMKYNEMMNEGISEE